MKSSNVKIIPLSPVSKHMTFYATCLVFMTFSCVCFGVAKSSSGTLELAKDLAETSTGSSEHIPIVHDCKERDNQCHKDKAGYDAIISLHGLIDDDKNGNVDLQESDEFLRDEMQLADGHEKQQKFHGNDKLVTIDDLWKIWRGSEVYNWTEDEVLIWLDQHVDLPQYTDVFRAHHVDGQSLPRLACTKSPYMSVLGIVNSVHRQKLSLKAMDLVLFGVPKKVHNYVKDVIILTLLVAAVGVCWFAVMRHRHSQKHVQKLMKDLEALQKAEDSLSELQEKLKSDEISSLNYNGASCYKTKDPKDETAEEVARYEMAEAELEQIRSALRRAEKELEHQNKWIAPSQLQHWLQYTYEVEQIHFSAKKHAAESQLKCTKDLCERMKKRNRSFLGSLRTAHSTSLDDFDQQILNARSAISEVKHDMQERLQRWTTIEQFCGFPIMSNPGMPTLKQVLQREISQGSYSGLISANGLSSNLGIGDEDEDLPPSYPAAGHHGIGITAHRKAGGMGSQGSLSRVGLSRVNNSAMTPDSAGSSNGHGPVTFNLGENLISPQPDLIGQVMGNYHNGVNPQNHSTQPSLATKMKHSQSYDLASSASESSLTSFSERRTQSSSALKIMTLKEVPEITPGNSSEKILDNSLKKKKKGGFLKLFKTKAKK